ncbi:MAG: PHP domain-containing protein [bacterium]
MYNIISKLNAPNKDERLSNARELRKLINNETIILPALTDEVNNHVHTIYSFSPYSPTAAAWGAMQAGLQAVGIMDHDSVSGIDEMLQAGEILGIATTAGCEIRVSMRGTMMETKSTNYPGVTGFSYIALHGIPANAINTCKEFLKPMQIARNKRNEKMIDKLNSIITPLGLELINFQEDVYNQSMANEGGAITERHILAALSRKIINKFGKGPELISFVVNNLKQKISSKIEQQLLDTDNPHYLYDLLGILKAEFAESFFLTPNEDECIPVKKAIAFANSIGAISAYAYLGDVTESPTGDKKAEKFEDEYLDDLIITLKDLGFRAVTYMPPRNTIQQLQRIRNLCEKYNLMQISGVDINSSRQTFNCKEILDPQFSNLIIATWALIGHEKFSTVTSGNGLFGENATTKYPDLSDRLSAYYKIGKSLNSLKPYEMPDNLPF